MSSNDNTISRQSGAAVSEGAFVKYDGSQKIIETASDTDEVLGVAQTSTDGADEEVTVQIDGRYDLALVDGNAGAITEGDDLMPGTGGKALAHTGNAGEVFCGMALQGSSADGDRISVKLYDGTITA